MTEEEKKEISSVVGRKKNRTEDGLNSRNGYGRLSGRDPGSPRRTVLSGDKKSGRVKDREATPKSEREGHTCLRE